MVPSIKDNGWREKITLGTAAAFKYGQMARDMTDFGSRAWLMEEEDLCMQMAMYIPVIGKKTRLMGMAYNRITTEADTKASGLMINNTERALKLGLMALPTMVNIKTE
jgi:hypothetical protein